MAINDPFIDAEYMAYMLKYDTVHGKVRSETPIAAHQQQRPSQLATPALIPSRAPTAAPIAQYEGDVKGSADGFFVKGSKIGTFDKK